MIPSQTYNNMEYLFNERSDTNDPSNLRTEIAKVINYQLFYLKNYQLFYCNLNFSSYKNIMNM